MIPSTTKRVPAHTAGHVNEEIRRQTEENIARYAAAGPEAIDRRLEELDREWDIERTLEANAATVALVGLGLGTFVDRRYLPAARRRSRVPAPARRPGLVPAGAGVPPPGVPHRLGDRRGALRPEGAAGRLPGCDPRRRARPGPRRAAPSRPSAIEEDDDGPESAEATGPGPGRRDLLRGALRPAARLRRGVSGRRE